ncbi:phasin family protein [Novosphingobium cyanobacteriorum]|uniref:TIGR01841 family phasin n=1 Tax=Novosphingobium cyanobacteriorum TaxID=3024215 RepID=A0ABT6CEP6_9SPHN|nr:TIGR01841 family phasin [Novosphingobium cyanobacteriorum]MDF8331943.1 TIGR01841 family phasin [Novosphingobium cyanobacteriorum]
MAEDANEITGIAPEAEGAVAAPVVEVVEPVAAAPEAIVEAAAADAGIAAEPAPVKKKGGRPRKDAVKVEAEPAPVAEALPAEAPVSQVPTAKPAKVKAPRKAASTTVKAKPVAKPVKASPVKVKASKPAPVARPAKAPKIAVSKFKSSVINAAAPAPGAATAPRKEQFKMATPTEMTEKFTSAFKDASEKAKAAFEKSQASLGDVTEFAKGNVEAMVESTKILASGLQEMGKGYVTESKSVMETLTEELKGLTSVKSPTEFFEKQSALLRKQFDAAVAASSKNSEAMLKLANEAFQPISNRVSIAVEKMKQAA